MLSEDQILLFPVSFSDTTTDLFMAKTASCSDICKSFLLLLVLSVPASTVALSFGFYAATCPAAEFMVRNIVRSASSVDPSVPGKLLRLLFHDCFVEVSNLV